MPSSLFRFKQFHIRQDACAMKVSTDAILLGAWADASESFHALDIGTGTGVLALMLAQRFAGLSIEAIEIDGEAYKQARENLEASPWKNRLWIFHKALQAWTPARSFDFIICNPPYFEGGPESRQATQKQARHQSGLSFGEILHFSNKHLNKNGKLSLVIPADGLDRILKEALSSELFPVRKTTVSYTPDKAAARILLEFKKGDKAEMEDLAADSLVVQEGRANQYSAEFVRLTREFYEFMD